MLMAGKERKQYQTRRRALVRNRACLAFNFLVRASWLVHAVSELAVFCRPALLL